VSKYKDRDVIKVVCFSLFDHSYVLDHMEHSDSYLLKSCRDSTLLEQMVDTIHPDIIMIDCTCNGSDMAEPLNLIHSEEVTKFDKWIEPEKPIELDNVVNSDEEIFFCDGSSENQVEYNSGKPGNHTHSNNPDIEALISYLPAHLPISNIARKGQIIFLFDSDPGMQVKLQCLENRCDLLIAPFLLQELDFRIRLHAEQNELKKRVSWQQATINRAVEHIDKLKKIILGTRDEFSREKELLYNSLKQINMMSRDRELIKKKLHRSKVELYENISGINNFLCTMVESRNEYQKGHSRRVADISEFVAEKIGLEAGAIKTLKSAALLHEVGMLLIPTSILNKEPSQLSDYEKNMMMLHPSNGAAYLEKCPGFQKVAAIISHLNENSDGTGSPEGLKKRYIPLASKVLAGADMLDQIWIDNPCASVERLLEILEEYAGSRLDPSIVNFLEKYVVTVLRFQIDYNQMDEHQTNSNYSRLKEIPVYQLKPGMVIGTGLFTKTGTKLFSPGTTMTEASIKMVEKYSKEYPVGETVFIKIDF